MSDGVSGVDFFFFFEGGGINIMNTYLSKEQKHTSSTHNTAFHDEEDPRYVRYRAQNGEEPMVVHFLEVSAHSNNPGSTK